MLDSLHPLPELGQEAVSAEAVSDARDRCGWVQSYN